MLNVLRDDAVGSRDLDVRRVVNTIVALAIDQALVPPFQSRWFLDDKVLLHVHVILEPCLACLRRDTLFHVFQGRLPS
jgi:hypothetical protein